MSTSRQQPNKIASHEPPLLVSSSNAPVHRARDSLPTPVSGAVGELRRSMTMKAVQILPLICLLWVCSNSMSRGLATEYYHVWKLDAAYDKPISDPEQWAADNFSDKPNAAKDDWKIERFELDIDHDGLPELFLTTPRLHGNGGGPHLVFQKRGKFHFYGGQLSGRTNTIRGVPVDADGPPRIMTFWNDGGGRGTASVWKWDGKVFQRISSEVIWSGDRGTEEGRRRFDELFGKKGIEQ